MSLGLVQTIFGMTLHRAAVGAGMLMSDIIDLICPHEHNRLFALHVPIYDHW